MLNTLVFPAVPCASLYGRLIAAPTDAPQQFAGRIQVLIGGAIYRKESNMAAGRDLFSGPRGGPRGISFRIFLKKLIQILFRVQKWEKQAALSEFVLFFTTLSLK